MGFARWSRALGCRTGGSMSPCRYGEASNGLKYFVWKLKHRTEGNRYARGKQYDLAELRTERARTRRRLSCSPRRRLREGARRAAVSRALHGRP